MSEQNDEPYNSVDALIACLETSNELLNILYGASSDQKNKEFIAKTINDNAAAIVEALDQEGADKFEIQELDIKPEMLQQMFGEGVTVVEVSDCNINRAVGLLEEIQEAYYLKDKIQPIINILKDGI